VLCGVAQARTGYLPPALETTQKAPEECCSIDDRSINLEAAKRLGMHTIEMDNVTHLREDFAKLDV
jgi:FMN phosphatase YigB (HAD superfamily)